MARIDDNMIEAASRFIWLTGGVLDQRRMAFIAGGAGRESVRAALQAHRTDDGGYAFALEPDVKGPEPQPISAMTALEILDEVDALDQEAAAPVCEWLQGHTAEDGGVPDLLPTIDRYPRPPWIQVPPQDQGGVLTTARITGLLLKHRIDHSWIEGATAFCRRAVAELESTHPYEVFSLGAFLDHDPDRAFARAASKRLGELVRDSALVLLNPSNPEDLPTPPGYAEEEFHFACDFATSPRSLAADWFSEAEMRSALDHLAAGQREDGGWQIHYRRWNPAIEQQARPGFTIAAIKTLRAWDQAG